MITSQLYILISIIVLLIIFFFVCFIKKNRHERGLTPLASIAMVFVLIGIFFGENRLIGYSLMGIGVLLSVIDVIIRIRK